MYILQILTFIVAEESVDIDTFLKFQCVCRECYYLCNSHSCWKDIPAVFPATGILNLNSFMLVKQKAKGTEGTCYHVHPRAGKEDLALRRARVYPNVCGEGLQKHSFV